MSYDNHSSKSRKQAYSEELPLFSPADFKKTRMTVKEAMDCFSVCRTTIFNWERGKILLAQRIGRRVYYTLNPNQQSAEVANAFK